MSYLIVKWNRFWQEIIRIGRVGWSDWRPSSSLASPGTKACDAVGGAFRSEWRERPRTDYWANLVRAGSLASAAVCNICITSCLLVTRSEPRIVPAGALINTGRLHRMTV